MRRKDKLPAGGNGDDGDIVNLSKTKFSFRIESQFIWELGWTVDTAGPKMP